MENNIRNDQFEFFYFPSDSGMFHKLLEGSK